MLIDLSFLSQILDKQGFHPVHLAVLENKIDFLLKLLDQVCVFLGICHEVWLHCRLYQIIRLLMYDTHCKSFVTSYYESYSYRDSIDNRFRFIMKQVLKTDMWSKIN